MKKKFILGLFILPLIVAHVFTLQVAPEFIMAKAMKLLAQKGLSEHSFSLSPRITPQSQSIVRPSPDLAYSICLFDLSTGPVLVKGEKWNGYGSITIFNANTDAVYVASLDQVDTPPPAVILAMAGTQTASVDLPIITLKNPKGVALIRRLAPTIDLFEQVQSISQKDICARIPAP